MLLAFSSSLTLGNNEKSNPPAIVSQWRAHNGIQIHVMSDSIFGRITERHLRKKWGVTVSYQKPYSMTDHALMEV